MLLLPMLIIVVVFWICVLIVKRIYNNYKILQQLKNEQDFLPHSNWIFGSLKELQKMEKLGFTGAAASKQISIRGKTFPFCDTGAIVAWGGNLLFPFPMLFPTRVEILRAILTTKQRVDKGLFYAALKDIFGAGLISSDRVTWAKHRKLLNPTFHQGMLQNFVPVMSVQGQILVQNLTKEVLKGPLVTNFTDLTSARVMAMLLETIMGAKEEDINPHFREIAENFDNTQFKRVQNLLKMWSWGYSWTQEGKQYFDDAKFLRSEARRLINKRIIQLRQDVNSNEGKMTLVDALVHEHLKDPKEMTLEMIVDEVITFLSAGWDTTTWTTTFVLQHVGSNPEIQETIFQEIDSQLDGVTDDHLLTMEDISKLKYLECVVNETLRFLSLVNVYMRHLYEDLEVDIDGKIRKFPAGTEVVIDSRLVHRNPRYWKDPDRFMPERFLPKNSVGRDPLAFIPFSYGPRNCIGKTFAMCEEKIILAQVFRKFKVTAVDPLDKITMMESGLAQRAKDPMRFYFELRQQS